MEHWIIICVNGEDTELNHSIFTLNNSSCTVKFVTYQYVLQNEKQLSIFTEESKFCLLLLLSHEHVNEQESPLWFWTFFL